MSVPAKKKCLPPRSDAAAPAAAVAASQNWMAPYSVLKRALHLVWRSYLRSVGKTHAGSKGSARPGRLRLRQEEDDGVMTFPVHTRTRSSAPPTGASPCHYNYLPE